MSTRSMISKSVPGGYKAVYCHFDGYPSGVGATLRKHYKNPTKINKLLSLGDLSILDKEIGRKHKFDKRVKGWCKFYGRDRGEKGINAKKVKSLQDLKKLADNYGTEYLYVYEKGKWHTFKV